MRPFLPALIAAVALAAAGPAEARRGAPVAPGFGDVTFGLALGGSMRPVEPGENDLLLSPLLGAEANLQLPALFSVGGHVRAEAAGPAAGWELAFAGIVGAGTTVHGDGRASVDLFLGLPLPVDGGFYVQPFFRGGTFLDAADESYATFGLGLKWSSFLWKQDRGERVRRPPRRYEEPPRRPSRPRPAPPPPSRPRPRRAPPGSPPPPVGR